MAIQLATYVICVDREDAYNYVIQKYVRSRFGAVTGDSRYDPRADINGDGKIDIRDIAQFAKDTELTFKTFGVIPVLWQQAALYFGLGIAGAAAVGVLAIIAKR